MAANMYRVGGMYANVGLYEAEAQTDLHRPAVLRGLSPRLGSGSGGMSASAALGHQVGPLR